MKHHARIYTFVILLGLISCSKKTIDTSDHKSNGTDSTNGTSSTCSAVTSDFLGITIFPADNSWNEDISSKAVDPSSIQILSGYSTAGLKADFGSGLWDNAPIGIPFVVVCGISQKFPYYFGQTDTMEIMATRAIPALIRYL